MSTYIEPTKDHLEAVRVHPHEGPVVMLNLLRFDFDDDGEARFNTYVEPVPIVDTQAFARSRFD